MPDRGGSVVAEYERTLLALEQEECEHEREKREKEKHEKKMRKKKKNRAVVHKLK